MSRRRVIIVGGVAGGASAAARLRRMDEDAEILMFEKGAYISFANCGLPYYIGDVIRDKAQLQVLTPQEMARRFLLDVRINTLVTDLDVENKQVRVKDLASGREYAEPFDKLILSPGAEPMRPPILGADAEGVFTLRTIPDTYAIKEYVDRVQPVRAVIAGGGFIGLEMAENLSLKGIEVSLVEMSDQVLAPLDWDMAAHLHQHLRQKGIDLHLSDGIQAIQPEGHALKVVLKSGETLDAQLVVLSVGVKPDAALARAAGLKIGSTGGIWVNGHQQTSHPDVYAVGDAVEVPDYVSGAPSLIPLAGPANKQGRIAANHICGLMDQYTGTQGTAIVKVFDLAAASTGNSEKSLLKKGIPYVKSYTHGLSHAGYYPGAKSLSIKLLFSPDRGKLLGAQIVGQDGVDKRIDVLAAALRAGMTVHDLEQLELAYAPPFSSAKDPINMAGYTGANILKGHHPVIYWEELAALGKDSLMVDVRTEGEHRRGAIPGSQLLPLDDLRERASELPRDKEIVLYCQIGVRGYLAARILEQMGFDRVRNLSGGYKTYRAVTEEHGVQEEPVLKEDLAAAVVIYEL